MMGTYSGWSNYETWAVKLWLDNDEGSYRYMTDEAERRAREVEAEDWITAADFAAFIEAEHAEAAPELDGVFQDLLTRALSQVNWYEIAESYLSEARE
jgi:hypothetical protein